MSFQPKHWFDTPITMRWLNWLLEQFPIGLRLGLVWDEAPVHASKKVVTRLRELETEGRLFSAVIPPGMTSILQLGVKVYDF